MDASGEKREIERTSITSIHKEQIVGELRWFGYPISIRGYPYPAVENGINLYGEDKNALQKNDIQGKTYSGNMLKVSLIRNLKASAGRSTPGSSARKWTPRRAVVNSTSPLTKIAASSSSSKSVFLHDWWLINAEDGKGLAIGGFTYRNERKTLFRSAVIIKRHDAVTLETKDAMTILIGGYINRQYSLGNGFSTEILNRFMIGFPCDWEEYAASESTKPTDKPPSSCPVRNNIGDFVSSLSMNDTELLMKSLYEDLQKQVGKTPERASASVGSKNHGTTKATCCNVGVDDDDEIQTSKGKLLLQGNQVEEEELKRETSSSIAATKAVAAVEEEQKKTDKKLNKHLLLLPKRLTRSMTKLKT